MQPSDSLPAPLAPVDNHVDEAAAEPEPESEAEPESEPESGYDHGSNSVAEPESEPSTKGEPEVTEVAMIGVVLVVKMVVALVVEKEVVFG